MCQRNNPNCLRQNDKSGLQMISRFHILLCESKKNVWSLPHDRFKIDSICSLLFLRLRFEVVIKNHINQDSTTFSFSWLKHLISKQIIVPYQKGVNYVDICPKISEGIHTFPCYYRIKWILANEIDM